MDNRYFSVFDMAIAGIPAIAFAVWQIISVNREIRRDREHGPPDSPESSGHPIGQHGLDDR